MKRIYLLICFLLSLHVVSAQTTYTVSGTIKDTTGQEMIGANLLLIAGRDSLHTTTNEHGKFSFMNVPQPVFTLKVSIMGYETWYREFSYKDAGTAIDLPQISMIMKTSTLQEVVVKGRSTPLILKEDTIEYKADQYKLRANAAASDLFKRVPGMEVDKDGNINSQGKKITKVRINGKDFLIDDIRNLTRILPANMIDKIQLIDDYGDMARATGRKLGEPERVINIQTKADLNKAYQAQGIAGYGNDGRYNAAVMINSFSDRQQLSLIGNTNNINTQTGDVVNTTGNFNYRGTYSKALTTNAALMGSSTISKQPSSSNVTTVTSEGTLYSVNNSNNDSRNDTYNFIAGAEYKPDTLTTANFNINAALMTGSNVNAITALQSGLYHKDQVTSSIQTTRMPALMGGVFASHRFKNSGKILSFSLFANGTGNDSYQDSYDSIRYYNNDNTVAKDSVLHQLLDKKNNTITTNAQLSYIQPLGVTTSFELKYGLNSVITDNKQVTQWVDVAGKANFIDSLSNHYAYTMTQHQVELNFRQNKGNLDYTFGARIQPSILRSTLANDRRTMLNSNSIVPVFRVQYKMPHNATLSLSYMGNVAFPTYQQLQPIPDLTNAQFPIVGNPDLRTSFTHSLYMNYRMAGVNTLFIHLSGNLIKDNIVTNTVLVKDSFNTVKQETRFLNADGSYNFRFIYGWSHQFANGKYNLFADGNSAYNNNILYLDNVRKTAQNLMITQSVRANMLQSWLELTGAVSYTYNRNVYVLAENNITNLGTWVFNFNGKVYFLKTFSLGTDINKQVNTGYAGENTNPLMINGTLEKTFLKQQLTCRIQGFNLLGETANMSQAISGNTVTESRNSLLGRYFMLTLQCDLRLFKGRQK